MQIGVNSQSQLCWGLLLMMIEVIAADCSTCRDYRNNVQKYLSCGVVLSDGLHLLLECDVLNIHNPWTEDSQQSK